MHWTQKPLNFIIVFALFYLQKLSVLKKNLLLASQISKLDDFSKWRSKMTQVQSKIRLEESLRKKEVQAKIAKEKGMNTAYSNRLQEIQEIKRKLRMLSMGS